jgi:hypothetical protein
MAVLTDFTGPATATPGNTYTFDALFSLDPGVPDEVYSAKLFKPDGTEVGAVQVTFDQPNPEPDPVGYYIRIYNGAGTDVTKPGVTSTGVRTSPSSYELHFSVPL